MKKITILLKAIFITLLFLCSTNFYAQIDFDGDNCEPHSLSGLNYAEDIDNSSISSSSENW